MTPQGYVSGSQPKIVGYQIVPSDNYADQQVSSLSDTAKDAVLPGLRYSQQQHYGQQAQLYSGANANLQPQASNTYGQYSGTNTDLQPQASNSYGQYSGTGNLQPQNNNQYRTISRQRQHQVGRINRLPTVDTGNYQSQASYYRARNGGRALHGSRKPNQYQNRRSRNKQQSDDALHVPVYVPISFRDKKVKTKKGLCHVFYL